MLRAFRGKSPPHQCKWSALRRGWVGMGVLEVTEMYLLETLSLFPRVDNTVHKEDTNFGHIRQHLCVKKSTYGQVAQHRACI